tara:strand:- start:36 stop:530 length:495 start_codon:yes stop_codon:yes gene_type:complete
MPDPNSTALTDFQVHRIDYGHPLWNKYKLAKRMQILRRDLEACELSGVVALGELSANHTLVAPGGAATDSDKTEITSRIITVSTDASARTLNLPSAADFTGELYLVIETIPTDGSLVVSGSGGSDVTYGASVDPAYLLLVSDGTDWYAAAVASAAGESLLDITS